MKIRAKRMLDGNHIIQSTLVPLCLLLSTSTADSSTVILLTLRQQVTLSDHIFVGTVSAVTSEWLPDHTTILTKVAFVQVSMLKGPSSGGALTLSLKGGIVNEEEIVVHGQPIFEIGDRCFVLCAGDLGSERNSYSPIIGLFQGLYRVKVDQGTGNPYSVFDHAARPLVKVESGVITVVGMKPVVTTAIRAYGFQEIDHQEPLTFVDDNGKTEGIPIPLVVPPAPGTPPPPVERVPKPWAREQAQSGVGQQILDQLNPLHIIQPTDDTGGRVTESQFREILNALASENKE